MSAGKPTAAEIRSARASMATLIGKYAQLAFDHVFRDSLREGVDTREATRRANEARREAQVEGMALCRPIEGVIERLVADG